MAEKKRKLTEAQRKVRRSQVGKQRRATHPGAHFQAGAQSAGHSTGERHRELINMLHPGDVQMVNNNPNRAAREMSIAKAKNITGSTRLNAASYMEPPVRLRQETAKKLQDADKESRWRTEPDVYTTPAPQSLARFWNTTAASSHKAEIDKMMADPHSPFNKDLRDPGVRTTKGKYNPGQRRRLEQYTGLIQRGYPHDRALQRVSEARQGRQAGAPGAQTTSELRAGQSRETARRSRAVPARTSRYEQAKPKAHELSFGIGIGTAQKADDIRQALGRNITDQDIVMIQQAQNRQLLEEFQKNQLWAQETRRANILTGKNEGRAQDPDRVTIFTTSMGTPSASVPTDSLIGQYIIKRRKKSMDRMGFTAAQLKGKFPQAVRDIHIFEAATGIEAGVQGDYGLYQKTGYRRGSRPSKGYGKPVPIGSQVMYDSQGRPMYDQAGNIRFTEGATRRFRKASTPLSLGVFVG